MKGVVLLVGILFCSYFATAVSTNGNAGSTSVKDSLNTVRVVTKSLDWYRKNFEALSKIRIVDLVPGAGYKVNFQNGDKYLAYLKSSTLFTNRFLNEWRTYFHDRQQGFLLKAQHEGIPLGFEYDFVLLSEDPSAQLLSGKPAKIISAKVARGKAVVQLEYGYVYEFNLVLRENRWLIDEILNLSLE